MEPWIKVYRKFTDWEWYSDVTTKAVFLHLLLTANYKPTKWKGEIIGAGEVVISRKRLSQKLGISEQQVRTALCKLEESGTINRNPTNRYTVIRIVNYCDYQPAHQPTDNQQNEKNQPTDNQQTTSEKSLDYWDCHNSEFETQPKDNQQITNKNKNFNQQITTTKEFKNKELINNINNNNACARENNIYTLYQENIGVPSPIAIQILQDLATNHDAALVELAICEAVKANARNIKYIEGIFRTWDAEGVRTVEDAKLKIAEHQSRSVKSAEKDKPMPTRTSQPAKKKNAFQDYDSDMTDFDAEIIRQRVSIREYKKIHPEPKNKKMPQMWQGVYHRQKRKKILQRRMQIPQLRGISLSKGTLPDMWKNIHTFQGTP